MSRFEDVATTWHQMIHNMAVQRASPVADYDTLMQEAHIALWREMEAKPELEWHGGMVRRCVGYRMLDLVQGKRLTGEPRVVPAPGRMKDPMRTRRESLDEMADASASEERIRAWSMRAWMKISSPSAEEVALRDMDADMSREDRVREALEAVSYNGMGEYDATIGDFALMKSNGSMSWADIEQALGKKHSTLLRAWERRTRPLLREMLNPLMTEGSAA